MGRSLDEKEGSRWGSDISLSLKTRGNQCLGSSVFGKSKSLSTNVNSIRQRPVYTVPKSGPNYGGWQNRLEPGRQTAKNTQSAHIFSECIVSATMQEFPRIAIHLISYENSDDAAINRNIMDVAMYLLFLRKSCACNLHYC